MYKYRQISSAILDWSGTTIDRLVRAPTIPFIQTFKHFGVTLTNQEARLPMGLPKDQHIRQILQIPSVQQKWMNAHRGQYPDLVNDTQKLFQDFLPRQLDILKDPQYISPLPNVIETLKQLKEMKIKIGLTTGFNCEMTQVILDNSPELAKYFDAIIPADHPAIKRGRPFPDAVWQNMIQLGTEHVKDCIKVDDTQSGILEGQLAGVWTVGLTKYNNYVGTQCDDIDLLKTTNLPEYDRILEESYEHLLESNPTFIAPTLDELPSIIRYINRNINRQL